ncbi:hypothetical protein Q3G72_014714 [Acer saccharum]|nr:hypothetical protein Q3G72_014714 [Acer saccharum]
MPALEDIEGKVPMSLRKVARKSPVPNGLGKLVELTIKDLPAKPCQELSMEPSCPNYEIEDTCPNSSAFNTSRSSGSG